MIDRTTAQKIIFGTVQFGSKYGVSNQGEKPSEQDVFATLDEARRLGIERLDTAEGYGDAMAAIGRYHASHPAFKVLGKFNLKSENENMAKKVDDALKLLGINAFEVYSYHAFHDFTAYPGSQEELAQLKAKKLINKIGVSVYDDQDFEAAIQSELIEVIQVPFNLFDNHRKKRALIAKAKNAGKEVHIRSVFLQGLFFMDQHYLPLKLKPLAPYLQSVKDFCREQNLSVSALALTYALLCPSDGVLMGVDRAGQLTENLSSLVPEKGRIINDFVDTLDIKEVELLNPVNWQ